MTAVNQACCDLCETRGCPLDRTPDCPRATTSAASPGGGDVSGAVCTLNRCGRPQGSGTWATVGEATIPVCEDHWQALRNIFPLPSPEATTDGASDAD